MPYAEQVAEQQVRLRLRRLMPYAEQVAEQQWSRVTASGSTDVRVLVRLGYTYWRLVRRGLGSYAIHLWSQQTGEVAVPIPGHVLGAGAVWAYVADQMRT